MYTVLQEVAVVAQSRVSESAVPLLAWLCGPGVFVACFGACQFSPVICDYRLALPVMISHIISAVLTIYCFRNGLISSRAQAIMVGAYWFLCVVLVATPLFNMSPVLMRIAVVGCVAITIVLLVMILHQRMSRRQRVSS